MIDTKLNHYGFRSWKLLVHGTECIVRLGRNFQCSHCHTSGTEFSSRNSKDCIHVTLLKTRVLQICFQSELEQSNFWRHHFLTPMEVYQARVANIAREYGNTFETSGFRDVEMVKALRMEDIVDDTIESEYEATILAHCVVGGCVYFQVQYLTEQESNSNIPIVSYDWHKDAKNIEEDINPAWEPQNKELQHEETMKKYWQSKKFESDLLLCDSDQARALKIERLVLERSAHCTFKKNLDYTRRSADCLASHWIKIGPASTPHWMLSRATCNYSCQGILDTKHNGRKRSRLSLGTDHHIQKGDLMLTFLKTFSTSNRHTRHQMFNVCISPCCFTQDMTQVDNTLQSNEVPQRINGESEHQQAIISIDEVLEYERKHLFLHGVTIRYK